MQNEIKPQLFIFKHEGLSIETELFTSHLGIQMVDVNPISKVFPSAYWILLYANLQHYGLGQMRIDEDGQSMFLPLDAARMFLASEWANQTTVEKRPQDYQTYLMVDKATGYYKIGRSNNPYYREKTLQSEKPTIELICFTSSDIEGLLHRRYASNRVRGEWFALSPSDVSAIITLFAQQ